MSTAEPEPGAALLNHLIDASQARCADHVSVAGADSLAVCLALYRRGYDHATCRARASAPHTPDQATDVLWLLDVPG